MMKFYLEHGQIQEPLTSATFRAEVKLYIDSIICADIHGMNTKDKRYSE
jgi:FMN-dependent NADH-azoreductase